MSKISKLVKLFLKVAAVASLAGFFFFLPSKITIREIICKSQYGPCANSLQEKLATFENNSLRESSRKIEEAMKKEVGVNDHSLQYRFPDKILVSIIEAKSRFAIKAEGEDRYFYIDKNGKVLKSESYSPLPYIEVSGNLPEVGGSVEEDELFALELLEHLFSLYQITSGKVENRALTVDMNPPKRVIFPLEGNKNVLIGSLIVILDKLKKDYVNLGSVSEIDLRFENPVLR